MTQRRISRDRVVAAAVAILLVAVAMVGYRLSDSDSPNELIVVPLDEPRPYQTGRVLISDVRVAKEVRERDKVSRSPGLYVVVRVTAQATGVDQVVIGDSRLVAADTSYDPAFVGGGNVTAEPGFEKSSDVVFEVDPARMAGLTLEVWQQGVVYRYYERAQTPLGITSQNADRWAAAGRDVQVTIEDDSRRALP